MSEWVAPVRVTSSATEITVSSSSTALSVAAAELTAAFPAGNEYAVFHGPTSLTEPGGLGYNVAHPTSGVQVDPTEDGGSIASPSDTHTAIDWAAKGIYDPSSKRVFWASCGAGNNSAGGYLYNTMPIYDEVANSWSVSRGFRGANETGTATPIVHMYDGNTIDETGRRFYKKKLSREVMVYNLDTDAWLNNISYSAGEPGSYGWDAGLEWIPSRNALWIRSIRSSDNGSSLFELTTAGVLTTLKTPTDLGSDAQGSVCCLNPRAFGGTGGVFVGGSNAVTIELNGSLTVRNNTTSKPTGAFMWPNGAHVCRDPVGDGWLHASTDGYMYRLTSGGTWSQRAQLPVQIRNVMVSEPSFDIVMVPIDVYGVVWIIGKAALGSSRAWLYKP